MVTGENERCCSEISGNMGGVESTRDLLEYVGDGGLGRSSKSIPCFSIGSAKGEGPFAYTGEPTLPVVTFKGRGVVTA